MKRYLLSAFTGLLFIFLLVNLIPKTAYADYCGTIICQESGNLYNIGTWSTHICPSGNIGGVYYSGCGNTGTCGCTDYVSGACRQWVGACCYESPEYCSGGPSCFLPGTKIKMEVGEKNIEEVKKGDVLVSFDPQSRKQVLNAVWEPYSVTRDHYYTIKTVSGKEVKATDEHPFYTGEGSVPNKSLIQKAQALVNILYMYLQDGWQVIRTKVK